MSRRNTILLISAVILGTLIFFLYPQRSHFAELPNPNGYDALVRDAARITRNSSSLKEMTPNQLAALVITNEAAVRALRKTLSMRCVVPVQMSEEWIASQTTQLPSLRAAAQAMDAEAYYWQQKGDMTNALALHFDQFRLSHAMMRGGVLINFLVGSAAETWVARRMTNLLSGLNAEQCRQAAHFLEAIDSQRGTFEEISARELEWQRRTYSLFVRLKEGFKKHVLRETDPLSALADHLAGDSEKKYVIRTTEFRRLLLKLSARAYELETGSRPTDVSHLIPAYLNKTPRDPGTGEVLELP